jgi:PmbA/TldA metallopeptidase C-terminal domain
MKGYQRALMDTPTQVESRTKSFELPPSPVGRGEAPGRDQASRRSASAAKLLASAGLVIHLLLAGTTLFAQDDVILRAMRDELDRSMKKLKLENLEGPYFIAYRIQERSGIHASATAGSLLGSGESRNRMLTVEMRVGGPALDNTNFLSLPFGPSGVTRMFGGTLPVTVENDYDELRRQLWLATDGAYKKALDDLSKKRAALQNRTRSDEIPDFAKTDPVTISPAAARVIQLRQADLEAHARDLSSIFVKAPDIHTSSVRISGGHSTVWYINSEGSSFVRQTPLVSLVAQAATQADDGMPLQDFVTAYAPSLEQLPKKAELEEMVRNLCANLQALRSAMAPDNYIGPVLFEGQAAAEIFSQVFAPKLLAVRMPISDNPQMTSRMTSQAENPLVDRLGSRVLPTFLSVADRPALSQHGGVPLVGGYPVDDDAVRAGETQVVQAGILKTLLSTRNPVRGILSSSGNRRGNQAMPSNVIVTAEGGLAAPELKQRLIDLAKQRGKEYGILVRRVGNPSIQISRDRLVFGPMMPGQEGTRVEGAILAYQVFPDGRERLLRNAEFAQLSLSSFRDILAAGKDGFAYTSPFRAPNPNPFGSMMALEFAFGDIPGPFVSFAVPSLLFEEVSVRKPSGEFPKPPLSPNPTQ